MKKLSKILTIALALVMIVTLLSACGGKKAAPAEVYTCQSDFVEAGYEGDCINTNARVLVLNADGSYTLIKNFFVNQISGVVVAFTTDYFTGTYTATEPDADGVKTVTLSAPTSCVENMNGSASTSADYPDLLDGFAGGDVTVDVNTLALTINE